MLNKIKSIFAVIALLSTTFGYSQSAVNYNDVAVLVNTKDTVSVNIGKYFQTKRNIPAVNIINFSGPTSEIIDSLQFDAIRKQVEAYITAKGLTTKINYLVTTKGCPLKITRKDTCDVMIYSNLQKARCASFDSEIGLILGTYKTSIGQSTLVNATTGATINHSYYGKKAKFSRATYGFYLVTRLSGYSQADVYALIDRQGPNTYVNKSTAKFIFDDYSGSPVANLSSKMKSAADLLKARGWKVTHDVTATYLTAQTDVVGYVSWGFTDPAGKVSTIKGIPKNKWVKGAIGVSYYSFNGYTYKNQSSARSTLPIMTKEGVSGWFATVYEPWSFSFPDALQMFDMYTDETVSVRYNMAEAFYSAAGTYSWMGCIVGDPKTSITSTAPATGRIAEEKKETERKNWFLGTEAQLLTQGETLDYQHPNWVAEGESINALQNLEAGDYTVTRVIENEAGRTFETKQIHINGNDEVTELSLNEIEVNIFPNPFVNSFTIQNTELVKNISIEDVAGRVVYQATNNGNATINIEGANLSKGSYIIKLSNETSQTVKKVIKAQ